MGATRVKRREGIEIWNTDYREKIKEIEDASIDLVITDPPYGIDYRNNFTKEKHQRIVGDKDGSYKEIAEECYRVLKEGSHAYFFTRYDVYPGHYQDLVDAGFTIKNVKIVETGNVGGLGDLKGSYANNCEWVIFCHKGRRVFEDTELMRNIGAGRIPSKGRKPTPEFKTRFPSCWFGEEYPKSTYNASKQRALGIKHPTVKNVEYLKWLIELSSKPGDIVLDPFMGSGSTAIACIETGRECRGTEIVEEYFDQIVRRVDESIDQVKKELEGAL